jgi:hypothetical protein
VRALTSIELFGNVYSKLLYQPYYFGPKSVTDCRLSNQPARSKLSIKPNSNRKHCPVFVAFGDCVGYVIARAYIQLEARA